MPTLGNYSTSSAATMGSATSNVLYYYDDASSLNTSSSILWTTWNDAYCDNNAYTYYDQTGASGLAQQQQSGRRQGGLFQPRGNAPPSIEAITAQAEAIKAARVQAKARAEALLLENLNPEQKADFQRHRAFAVQTKDRKYWIEEGRVRNIKQLDSGGRVEAIFCIHPSGNIPDADVLLAQKLLIETDEAEFRRIANRIDIAA